MSQHQPLLELLRMEHECMELRISALQLIAKAVPDLEAKAVHESRLVACIAQRTALESRLERLNADLDETCAGELRTEVHSVAEELRKIVPLPYAVIMQTIG